MPERIRLPVGSVLMRSPKPLIIPLMVILPPVFESVLVPRLTLPAISSVVLRGMDTSLLIMASLPRVMLKLTVWVIRLEGMPFASVMKIPVSPAAPERVIVLLLSV